MEGQPPSYDDPNYTKAEEVKLNEEDGEEQEFPDFDPPDYYLATQKVPEAARYDAPPVEGISTLDGGDPSILYIDFLPSLVNQPSKFNPPQFESFKKIMDHVNIWLMGNPRYKVIRCESFERKLDKNTGNISTDETIWHEPKYGMVAYVSGLRLWLQIRNTQEESAPQQLGYVNVIPRNRPMKLPVYAGMHMGMGFGLGLHMQVGALYFPDFEDLDKTVEKFNRTLDDNPLPGSVLTIETLDWKYHETWHDNCMDPDATLTVSQNKSWKLYVTFLRVFFELGPPSGQKIGIQDFIPNVTYIPSRIGFPRYEDYDLVLEKAQNWLLINNGQGKNVTNIQTIQAKVKERNRMRNMDRTTTGYYSGFSQDNSRTFQVLTNQTQFAADTITQFVKVIRAAYVIPNTVLNREPFRLTSRLFVPVQITNRKSETTSQTVQRINAWIHAAGAKVVGVDTLQFEHHPESKKMKVNDVSFIVNQTQGHYWMTAIRLYIEGEYSEPDPSMLPPVPDHSSKKASNEQSECCTIL